MIAHGHMAVFLLCPAHIAFDLGWQPHSVTRLSPSMQAIQYTHPVIFYLWVKVEYCHYLRVDSHPIQELKYHINKLKIDESNPLKEEESI